MQYLPPSRPVYRHTEKNNVRIKLKVIKRINLHHHHLEFQQHHHHLQAAFAFVLVLLCWLPFFHNVWVCPLLFLVWAPVMAKNILLSINSIANAKPTPTLTVNMDGTTSGLRMIFPFLKSKSSSWK